MVVGEIGELVVEDAQEVVVEGGVGARLEAAIEEGKGSLEGTEEVSHWRFFVGFFL